MKSLTYMAILYPTNPTKSRWPAGNGLIDLSDMQTKQESEPGNQQLLGLLILWTCGQGQAHACIFRGWASAPVGPSFTGKGDQHGFRVSAWYSRVLGGGKGVNQPSNSVEEAFDITAMPLFCFAFCLITYSIRDLETDYTQGGWQGTERSDLVLSKLAGLGYTPTRSRGLTMSWKH